MDCENKFLLFLHYLKDVNVNFGKKYGKIKTSTGQITSNDEILKLQKENQEIKTENEILKKALAIFSRQQKIK